MNKYSTIKGTTLIRATDGRIIGWVKNDVLGKKVKASKHMLQKPRGWAWDVSIIDEAEKLGARRTEIFDQESGKYYKASLERFHMHGVKLDRGFGPQLCLPIAFWTITCPDGAGLEQLDFGW